MLEYPEVQAIYSQPLRHTTELALEIQFFSKSTILYRYPGSTFTGVDHRPKLCRRLGVFSYTGRLAHDSNLRFPLLFSMR
jgi:hypothetical protein